MDNEIEFEAEIESREIIAKGELRELRYIEMPRPYDWASAPGQRCHVTLKPADPELKPCPFCGGEALNKLTYKSGIQRFRVLCLSCGARTEADFPMLALARKAWNRRVDK